MFTEEFIREQKALCDKATPGPWTIGLAGDGRNHVMASCRHGGYADSDKGTDEEWANGSVWYNREDFDCRSNMKFCAAARTNYPLALAALERMAPVKPITNEDTKEVTCQCKYELGHWEMGMYWEPVHYKFCPNCGHPLIWE